MKNLVLMLFLVLLVSSSILVEAIRERSNTSAEHTLPFGVSKPSKPSKPQDRKPDHTFLFGVSKPSKPQNRRPPQDRKI